MPYIDYIKGEVPLSTRHTYNMKLFTILPVMLAANAFFAQASAEVAFSTSLFSDHMVLQQGMKTPVWGTAANGETVTVKIIGQTKTAVSEGSDRRKTWIVYLDPMPTGGPHEMTISGSGNTITIKDILVGEVWLGSGQSNMAIKLSGANSDIDLAAPPRSDADHPDMRLNDRDMSGWVKCSPQTIQDFSAVEYFFGNILRTNITGPIGLINRARDATSIRGWSPALDTTEIFAKAVIDYYRNNPGNENVPKQEDWIRNGYNFTTDISRIIPYGMRGVIWWQGEHDDDKGFPEYYRAMLPAMIRGWRRLWDQGDFPFVSVQVNSGSGWSDNPAGDLPSAPETGGEMYEAYYLSTFLNNVGTAIVYDYGGSVHPPKWPRAQRLARWVLAKVYGKDMLYSGPIYDTALFEGSSVRIRFRDITGTGLKAYKGDVLGFSIAGADRKFVWADATIEGSEVVVSSSQVPNPAIVRYGWSTRPVWATLMNADSVPASPFRTDQPAFPEGFDGATVTRRNGFCKPGQIILPAAHDAHMPILLYDIRGRKMAAYPYPIAKNTSRFPAASGCYILSPAANSAHTPILKFR